MVNRVRRERRVARLQKCGTGVAGLDAVTGGGLPRDRSTLIVGGPGCGKTLLATTFLVAGAEAGEPGVFVGFEEDLDELVTDAHSTSTPLDSLVDAGKIAVLTFPPDAEEVPVLGEFDLGGLRTRVQHAIDGIGAKRVVIDALDSLFDDFSNDRTLRREVTSLVESFNRAGITCVLTATPGTTTMTRHGHEEYLTDCVITLSNTVEDRISTRFLRVVKYRGSGHATDALPFVIGDDGIAVLPSAPEALDHPVSDERISTGIDDLDEMVGGGYFRGSSVLVSGGAGTGKTSMAMQLALAAAQRGEMALYLSFEEPPAQLVRNLGSIGLDLGPQIDTGRLVIRSLRSRELGLEMHVSRIMSLVTETDPSVVVLDPISNLAAAGPSAAVRSTLMRITDSLKQRGTTVLMTSLAIGSEDELGGPLSSLVDTWLLVRNLERQGERNRGLYVYKSRGMPHSNQIREFTITPDGIRLTEPYLGPGEVLTGSARIAQMAADDDRLRTLERRIAQGQARIAHTRTTIDAQLDSLRAEHDARVADQEARLAADEAELALLRRQRHAMRSARDNALGAS